MEIGFHASHEQFLPSRLLALAQLAEEAGFEAVNSSDHFAPWTMRQGESGFAFAWLGAALATTRLPYGMVTAPGDRYHPAIVAQALATLAELAPGRIVPALGSGQALNEHITGNPWPDKRTRNARLAECAEVIRDLLAGKTVDHDGLVRVHNARLYTLPPVVPPLYAAALTPATAAEVATWSDGLITVNAPLDKLRQVLHAYRDAGGEDRPVHVQVHLSWADDDETARRLAVQHWQTNGLNAEKTENLTTPEEVEAASAGVTADDLTDSVVMSADLGRHAQVLAELRDLGVARVYLHQVGPEQERFVEAFADRVLPQLR